MKKLILWAALLAFSQQGFAVVWETSHEWSQRDELGYSQWLSEEASADLFASGQVLSVPLVPTAIPYAYRAYFSYQNGLPFIMRSRTKQNVFISNDSANWDAVEEGDRRFAQFLFDLVARRRPLADLSEVALWRASFPIRMDRRSLQPGVFYLRHLPAEDPEAKTQMFLLKSADYSSRVPDLEYYASQYRTLQLTRRVSTRRVVLREQPSGLSAYLAFRWPNVTRDGFVNPKSDFRFDPRDQYRDDFAPLEISSIDAFTFRIFGEISRIEVTARQALRLEVDDLCARLNNRKDWVAEAQEHLNQERQLDAEYEIRPGSPAYRRLSTPSRDRAIRRAVVDLGERYSEARELGRRPAARRAAIRNELASCQVQWGVNRSETTDLVEFTANLRGRNRRAFWNPNSSVAERWGAVNQLP